MQPTQQQFQIVFGIGQQPDGLFIKTDEQSFLVLAGNRTNIIILSVRANPLHIYLLGTLDTAQQLLSANNASPVVFFKCFVIVRRFHSAVFI